MSLPSVKNRVKIICLIFIFSVLFVSDLYSQSVETPVMDYVTVDQVSQKPIIVWSVTAPTAINGFSIKRLIYSHPSVVPLSIQTIDTVYDPFLTTYQDFTNVFGPALPYERTEQYGIVAINIEGTDTFLSLVSDFHKTMYLETEYAYCDNQTTLSWNRYEGWAGDFLRYEIYGREEALPFSKLGEINTNGQTVFLHENVNYNSNYEYYIIAVRDDGTQSFSNISEVYTQSIVFPAFLIADSVIVNEGEISLYFTTDINGDIENYDLYRSDIKSGSYNTVNNVDHDHSRIVINDPVFSYESLNYYYLAAKDHCDKIIFISDTVNNIVLEAGMHEDDENLINWRDENTGKHYTLIRCIEDDCEEIYSGYGFEFADQIDHVLYEQFYTETTSGILCYRITAREAGFVNISNIDCLTKEERYYMPNAFNPKSNIYENRTFKPKAAFITDYEMIIYGPSGNIIFQTNDPDSGWDGTMKDGKLASRASYLYFVSFKNSEGKKIRKKAFVTLVY